MARLSRSPALYWLLASALLCGGCSMLANLAFMAGGGQEKAEYEGLKEMKVAVVCRPLATLQFRNASAAKDVAKQVGKLLETNVKKIEVVNQRKVAEWTDENDWEDFTEIGKAVDADMVVAIDLEQFSLNEEQTLLQGKASVHVTVYDMRDDGKEVFDRVLQSVFPPNSPVASADKPEVEFYAQFIGVLSHQIAHQFYAHDQYLDFATDSNVLR